MKLGGTGEMETKFRVSVHRKMGGGRTVHFEVARLAHHGNGVDLAHVVASVLLAHIVDGQVERRVRVRPHRDAVILDDHRVVHGQQSVSILVEPSQLAGGKGNC